MSDQGRSLRSGLTILELTSSEGGGESVECVHDEGGGVRRHGAFTRRTATRRRQCRRHAVHRVHRRRQIAATYVQEKKCHVTGD